ncbi:hypothetical protein CDO73_26225 [Saccharibacillus sp. O23]|uniref:SprT-like domain-containing protein n=1 Tax=Saccharibacillus sp. O23 TaxID=2009338 RepID=UPI000B4E649C|nr:SprT-like domain-containing protein [Saccharibacillus sp. O23]OWR25677.1 hypothetical protein CDO73_26225 [Saccharibacillus sp. O23]
MSDIQAATDELHNAFKRLNKEFFNKELPTPAITIQASGKRKALSWCSTKEIWEDKDRTIKRYELNIAAEHLNAEFMDVMESMLHEMVHLYNAVNGIQDCSRNATYHNKRFKEECERRGFLFPSLQPNPKYGWAFPILKEGTKDRIRRLRIDPDAFVIARTGGSNDESIEGEERAAETEKKSNSYKWICPVCSLIVRSSKDDVFIICGEHNTRMEKSKS